MKGKSALRISIVINVLVIAALLFVGLKYRSARHSSLTANKENVTGLVLGDSAAVSGRYGSASGFTWPEGKKMALSFTFDDACVSQIENGIPIFDRHGVKATFYASIWNLEQSVDQWKQAIANGHEVGNHTYRHPCTLNYDFARDTGLEDYSLHKMSRELYFENKVIKDMLGIDAVSFAYPCGETFVGRGLDTKSYVPLIAAQFESGRGLEGGLTNPMVCDMSQLSAESLDSKTFEHIKELIDAAEKSGKWLILVGHEIGQASETYEAADTAVIEQICQYISDPEKGIWVDNVHNIASYVREKRGEGIFERIPIHKDFKSAASGKLWGKYYTLKGKLKSL